MVGTLDFFSLLQNYLFLERNNVNDMNIVGFSHQLMQLIFLVNHLEDQIVLLMHLEILVE